MYNGMIAPDAALDIQMQDDHGLRLAWEEREVN